MDKDERALATRIGSAVRRARTERGWSQLALAERADISLNYVSLLERAERLASIEVMIRLAAALGTTVAGLVGEAEPDDPSLTEATVLLRSLPADIRPVVLAMLRAAADAARSPKPAPAAPRPKPRKR